MRSTELNAVLGLKQIKRLDDNVTVRKNNLNVWLDNLNGDKYYLDFLLEGNSNFALPLLIKDKTISIKQVCSVLEDQKVEYRLGTAGGGNQARQPWLKNYEFKVVGELTNSNYIHDYGLYVGNHTELNEQQIIDLCRRLNNV